MPARPGGAEEVPGQRLLVMGRADVGLIFLDPSC